ncbi:bifunctional folylpolyglutamate synthase/dihydrofolate synthase [Mobilitalea sibirica]|uniref:tetrahydrofolate synthase n=1 Tax=Mobilitalea sibirica TaxID=1462919 RepID=A0A8J7H0S4_9FIRM|nr:folylpolyglutamate synthase/dihydrofolate synthase family protein [Mobilitalea sibirica]MBH1939793.1 bifunctional folylpolyglutamate synthase/dihydrofolate synthase [Mobilitalea sibirica]
MTYEEARKYIDESSQYGSKLGLETITELLRRLDNPQEKLNIVHIAGTNGKGSVAGFIATILTMAGYRVGRYISPAVFSYRERIIISSPKKDLSKEVSINRSDDMKQACFDGNSHLQDDYMVSDFNSVSPLTMNNSNDSIDIEYISKQGVSDSIDKIKTACNAMVQEGYAHPTTFEIETAMTFLYLSWMQVDFVVLEVGLGGRLDATNVITRPICSVITSISFDHMQYLGDTLAQIAKEKAGIIKKGRPVITCEQEPEVVNVIKKKAEESGSRFIISGMHEVSEINYSMDETKFLHQADEEEKQYKIRLLGQHQVKNALLAIRAVKTIEEQGYRIGEEAIRSGLYHTRWSGRFEIISKTPYIIMDGAHNEGAAITLRSSIETYFYGKRIIFIMGVLADKDYKSIIRITAPLADTIITLTPDNPRALSSSQLAKEVQAFCSRVIDGNDTNKAVMLALTEAKKNDVIVAFGSLSFLKDFVVALNENNRCTNNKEQSKSM